MRKIKYSKEQVQEAIKNANSQAEAIRNLGLKVNNGNYESIRYYAKIYDLELPIYDSSKNTEAAKRANTISDEDWFVEDSRRSGVSTRKRLIAKGYKDECECVQGPVWNNKPLTLQIDHIDGNKFNNKIENVRIICPHCHTQTDTYANNSSAGTRKYYYCECGKQISKWTKQCNQCNGKSRAGVTIIDFPEIEEIVQLIKDTNFTKAAQQIGCSDNAIRKHLTRNGVDWKKIK